MLKQLLRPAQRPHAFRPDWARMEAEHDYFCQVLANTLEGCGFEILGRQVHQDRLENQARDCVFVMTQEHQIYTALCLRWLVRVTSDVVGRFERGRRTTPASAGMIITTSLFTDAAVEAAWGSPIHLWDRHHLRALLEA